MKGANKKKAEGKGERKEKTTKENEEKNGKVKK